MQNMEEVNPAALTEADLQQLIRRLAAERAQPGMTTADVAEAMGVPHMAVTAEVEKMNLERRLVRIETELAALKEHTAVPQDDLSKIFRFLQGMKPGLVVVALGVSIALVIVAIGLSQAMMH